MLSWDPTSWDRSSAIWILIDITCSCTKSIERHFEGLCATNSCSACLPVRPHRSEFEVDHYSFAVPAVCEARTRLQDGRRRLQLQGRGRILQTQGSPKPGSAPKRSILRSWLNLIEMWFVSFSLSFGSLFTLFDRIITHTVSFPNSNNVMFLFQLFLGKLKREGCFSSEPKMQIILSSHRTTHLNAKRGVPGIMWTLSYESRCHCSIKIIVLHYEMHKAESGPRQ